MHIYKELSIVGDKKVLDDFKLLAPSLAHDDWNYVEPKGFKSSYISFDYTGHAVDKSEVSFYYGPETWRKHEIKIVNIVPIQKNQLTIDEYNSVLEEFYQDIIIPYRELRPSVRIIGPTSELFEPLNYISDTALKKLEVFCCAANKTTGSSHPCDEQRWFDFICQTVDDDRVFDFDTLYRFLMDKEYWGDNSEAAYSVMGKYAWDEEHAYELASEYDQYVRILRYYKEQRWQRKYEAEQK